jgi:hypothetical protein
MLEILSETKLKISFSHFFSLNSGVEKFLKNVNRQKALRYLLTMTHLPVSASGSKG